MIYSGGYEHNGISGFVTPNSIIPVNGYSQRKINYTKKIQCNIQMIECCNFKFNWSPENYKLLNIHYRNNIKCSMICNKFINNKILRIPKFVLYEIFSYIVN